mmetsp:Transcript_27638/g.88899  ORF Transcript_27638/g.88899 Transcript_27638/m.88899 type:complete len:203 (+) Transcript_27638:17-625(+)
MAEALESTHKTALVLRNKVVIVGDPTVGKSALTQMFHTGGSVFPKNYVMTTYVDFAVKAVSIPDTSAQVELYLFDLAGQSIFNVNDQAVPHWETANSLVLVFDVGSRDSFQSCAKWMAEIKAARAGSRPLPGVLVANKVDFRDTGRAEVSAPEAMEFARRHGLEYFETSAATGKDVDAPFNFLVNAFYRKYEERVKRLSGEA